MSYNKSYHKNALLKIVKEKRMILQVDAAGIMNRPNIQYAAQKLEEEGKIKRQKIKARYSNGNLNDVWLLALPEVKYEDILTYEMELVNRPYESPLKVHHCYKSKEDDIKSDITDEEIQLPANVININDYVKINNQELGIREYNNQRVVTLWDIARVHEIDNRNIKDNFTNNRQYLIEGEDYFTLSKVDYEKIVNEKLGRSYNAVKEIILFTEQGYLMIAKTITGELAWKVQRQLVDSYFRLKEISNTPAIRESLPQINFDNLDMFEILVKEMKNQRDKIKDQDNKIIELESKFNALKDALA